MTVKNHMAIDHQGNTIHGLGPFPRKGLLEKLGAKSCHKVYVDKKDGSAVHVGYIVRGRWFTVYEVKRMERPA